MNQIKIPVKVWAEVDGQRIESIIEIKVGLNDGQCQKLFLEMNGNALAKSVAESSIKTGWEILP